MATAALKMFEFSCSASKSFYKLNSRAAEPFAADTKQSKDYVEQDTSYRITGH
jgi:hypothetical protein